MSQHPEDHGVHSSAGQPPSEPPSGYRPPQPAPAEPDQAADQPAEDVKASQVNLQLPAFMKPLRPRHWVTLLAGQALGYVLLVAVAVVGLISVTIGAALGADDQISNQLSQATGVAELQPSMAIAILTLPFQTAAVWLLGSFGLTVSIPEGISQLIPGGGGGSDVGVQFWAPNLLFAALAAAATVWAARKWSARSAQGALTKVPRLARLIASLALALGMAGLTVLLTWAVSYRESFDLGELAAAEGASQAEVEQMAQFFGLQASDLAISISGSAAGFSLFAGAFVFYLLIGLGISVHSGFFAKLRAKAAAFLPSVGHVSRVLLTHGLLLAVPALIFAGVRLTLDGGALGAFSAVFWIYTAAVFGIAYLTFGAVTADGSTMGLGPATGTGQTSYLWTADFPWWAVVLGILWGLIAMVAASLVWAQRRDGRASTLKNLLSWLTLPLSYAVVGVVLTLFGQVRGSAEAFGAVNAEFTFGPAGWTFVILLLVGLVIEALSRFLAPMVIDKMPAPLKRMTGAPARA